MFSLLIRVTMSNPGHRLITIYDCKIALIWSATGANDTSIKGTVTIPEVSHENTLDGVSDYTVRVVSIL